MRPPSAALLRVLTGQGILPPPRWLENLLRRIDKRAVRIDPDRISDSDLSAMGVSRAEIRQAMRRQDWDPPAYWRTRDLRSRR